MSEQIAKRNTRREKTYVKPARWRKEPKSEIRDETWPTSEPAVSAEKLARGLTMVDPVTQRKRGT